MKYIVSLILVFYSSILYSDQRDVRLQSLFDQLQNVQNKREASEVEYSIWEIWTEHGDSVTNQKMALGIKAMTNGNLDQAMIIFNNLVVSQPDFAEGWNKRATLNYMRNDYEQSKSDIAQTLLLEPRHFGALSGLGLIYFRQEAYIEAIKAFESVLEINPQSSGSKINIEIIRELIVDQAI